jgi:hypothetical protein
VHSSREVEFESRIAAPALGQLDRILELDDRVMAPMRLKVRLGQLIVRESKIRIDFDRLAALFR